MIQISQIKLPVGHDEDALRQKICRQLKITPADIIRWQIIRRSLDARKKPQLFFVYTIELETTKERKILHRLSKAPDRNIRQVQPVIYRVERDGTEPLTERPVIIGSGPAGLFCAWLLAKEGFAPLIVERGDEASVRKEKVEAFWSGSTLDLNSNVQFGEGGAGTFSDGKLNTLVKDNSGRNRKVLELFVEAGAPEEILYDHKPHLGTDQLISIVTTLRRQITDMGGVFRFGSQVTNLRLEDGAVKAVEINQSEWIPAQVVVAAIGHSARDTFRMLQEKGIGMEQKSFAVGVRIEHPQTMINQSQYGTMQHDLLGAANYKLTHQFPDKRGIYSFCMCPGGYVVNASSEEQMLAVNGMSYHARDSRNANSAMIVTVSPQDYVAYAKQWLDSGQENRAFDPVDPLNGMYFQRLLERGAWKLNGGRVPVQTFGDFRTGKDSLHLGDVEPCIKGKWELSNLTDLFPDFLNRSLADGISAFGKKIQGFDRPDAVLSGVESRTSSPVRIPRNDAYESNIKGFYPCGEGAGYAGGITSAAMDGLRTGEAICHKFR